MLCCFRTSSYKKDTGTKVRAELSQPPPEPPASSAPPAPLEPPEPQQLCGSETSHRSQGLLRQGKLERHPFHYTPLENENSIRLLTIQQHAGPYCTYLARVEYVSEKAAADNPRDKVYGLKGLAYDAWISPEVWKDVMQFLFQNRSLPENEFISFGTQLKSMLMCDTAIHPQPSLETPCVYTGNGPSMLHLQGYIFGRICYVGPSIPDLEMDPKSVEVWNVKVRGNFPGSSEAAFAESHRLLYTLLHSNHPRHCLNNTSSDSWAIETRESSLLSGSDSEGGGTATPEVTDSKDKQVGPEIADKSLEDGNSVRPDSRRRSASVGAEISPCTCRESHYSRHGGF
ncbi:hypothetical protein PG984_007166 [Apiospora sp. TS-2023a]